MLGRPTLLDPSSSTIVDISTSAQYPRDNATGIQVDPTQSVNPTQTTPTTGGGGTQPTQTINWNVGSIWDSVISSVPWLNQQMITGVPNWGLVIGAGVAYYMFKGGKK